MQEKLISEKKNVSSFLLQTIRFKLFPFHLMICIYVSAYRLVGLFK